jgi:hypothetical protein
MEEARWFIASWVGICVAVGGIGSVVEVGTTVGGEFVGRAVAVGSVTGTAVSVQAVRNRNATMIHLFIASNYMPVHVIARRR